MGELRDGLSVIPPESVEFTINENTTNYNVKANQSDLFADIPIADFASVRVDEASCTIRMNDTGNDATTLAANIANEFNEQISNMFITTPAGATPTVRIRIQKEGR